MAISNIGLAGLGLGAAGGIAQAIGAGQRSRAFTQAGEAGVQAAQRLQAENAAGRRFFQPQAEALAPQRQEALNALLAALGPERTQRLGDARMAAAGLQQGAAQQIQGMIRPTANFMQSGGGLSTALAARRQEAARRAPGQQARALGLAHQMLQPGDAAAVSAFGDVNANLSREAQELQAAQGLRQALAARAAGVDQQRVAEMLDRAMSSGVGMGALGQMSENIGLGLTHHTAFPQYTTQFGNPDPTGEIARSTQFGVLDPRASLYETNRLVPESFVLGVTDVESMLPGPMTPRIRDRIIAERMAQAIGGF